MYDFAAIGDSVYVGGLQGNEFDQINNKVGVLKKIYSLISDNQIKYLANVKINDYEFPINLNYVYKLNTVITDPIFLENNILNEMYQLHDVCSATVGVDQMTYNRVVVCQTSADLKLMLVISTQN